MKTTPFWTDQFPRPADLPVASACPSEVDVAGQGLSIATYLGTEIGLLLSGQKTSSPFAEIPHQTMFFYRNKPWFIPLAAQYYRFLDWVS